MFKKMLLVSFLVSFLSADSINIFVAASAKNAMSDIIGEFKKTNPNDEVKASFGASGKAYAQFTNGFEYDIFFSADSTYPKKIADDGNGIGEAKIYALGAVALYSPNKELIKMGMDALKSEKVKHISIANPKVAPYGVSAMEILQNYDLKDSVSSKIVMGDNIAQSVQFVDSGAAEIGLVALSLLKNVKNEAEYVLVDSSKYKPLEQSFIITKYAKNKPLTLKFSDFVTSAKAKEIFNKYGFR